MTTDAIHPRAESVWLGLVVFLLLSALTASVAIAFPPGAWYQGLAKPPWTPPNWLFPVMWTALYILMAVAAWLVWRERGVSGARTALTLYIVQLVVNAAWSWLFFGRHWMVAGLVDIVLLFVLVAATALRFWYASRLAAVLLLPYLGWVLIAASLNAGLIVLNG